LNEQEIQRLLDESCMILSKCNESETKSGKAGLVVGYVQSGKTLSLTTVSSLARDNGYGMIIVLCGVTRILFSQNTDRLNDELINKMPFRFFDSVLPPYKSDNISSTLKHWHIDHNNPSLIIYVLKNQTNIRKLSKALSDSNEELHKITPTLIIDDEAHMASLNTQHESESESAVYAAMKKLRSIIPNHTYLQYTATPQAPLLVQLADCVSPDFAVTLTPGTAYIGGKEIFSDKSSQNFIRTIPEDELPGADNAEEDKAPESLRKALLVYLIGLTDGIIKNEHRVSKKNRTMLVHPASTTNLHDSYASFIKSILEEYKQTLGTFAEETSRELLKQQIETEYKDLKSTYPELSDLNEIINRFSESVTTAVGSIQKLNAQQINKVDWSKYAHILVGGEVLGVGFTVEGLTVTYMPREASGGQSDSMQQRARFLGYRKSFIGLVRIYLSKEDLELYKSYVKHEEEMRSELAKMAAENKTIKEWRRNFLIHSNLKLTRANIQSLETDRHKLETKCYPNKPFECDSQKNHEAFDKIVKSFNFTLDSAFKPKWGDNQRHLSAIIPLEEALNLLNEFSWPDADDSASWTVSSIILNALANEPEIEKICKIMIMSPGLPRRSREVVDDNWVSVFQGRNPNGDPESYQGDLTLANPNCLTIQLYDYEMNLKYTDSTIPSRTIDSVIVPVLIPSREMLGKLDVIRK
jgi:hypothetical protein